MGYEKLHGSVISDEEAQLQGDVEASFAELRELTGAPPVATDKPTGRIFVLASDHKLHFRDSSGNSVDLSGGASLGDDARDVHENYQAVAASTLANAIAARSFRAPKAGTIEECFAEVPPSALAAGVGESMTFDITINGVTCLTAPILIDDTILAGVPVVGAIDPAANAFAAGDLIEVIRTYVAGAAAMTETVASVSARYAD